MAFSLADKLIGEVPIDKYILPPWRFMDYNWYLKACIYNEIDEVDLEINNNIKRLDLICARFSKFIDQKSVVKTFNFVTNSDLPAFP